jgi:multidrug efflux pump subunit AcrA (membrane-fusion protein)
MSSECWVKILSLNAVLKLLSNTKLIAGQIVPGKIETFYPDATKGKVKEIFVKEGQKITKGQKLKV